MEIAPDIVQMMRARPAARIWMELAGPDEVASFDELAERAGIEQLGRGWVDVDQVRAREFLAAVLHRDLAYGREVMPRHRAAWLADEFLTAAGRFGSRFATNSADIPHEGPFSSTTATGFPCDTGVAAIGNAGAGLFWVADED